jgi:hypothetical protein
VDDTWSMARDKPISNARPPSGRGVPHCPTSSMMSSAT